MFGKPHPPFPEEFTVEDRRFLTQFVKPCHKQSQTINVWQYSRKHSRGNSRVLAHQAIELVSVPKLYRWSGRRSSAISQPVTCRVAKAAVGCNDKDIDVYASASV